MVYQGVKKLIVTRPIPKKRIQLSDVSPLLERIFLARGVTSAAELDRTLAKLPSPWLLSGMDVMVGHLLTAIKTRQKNFYRGGL